jgi:uncharacterized Zn finger protein
MEPNSVAKPELLLSLAGTRSFERGEAYFAAGAVRSMRRDGDGIKAVVRGTHSYRVHLWVEDGELRHDCTCPVGLDGTFCKHCVAAGLAWQAADGGETDDAGSPAIAAPDVRTYLMGLDREALVSMLLDQADEDERLYRRLSIRAASSATGAPDPSIWKEALDDATAADDFVPYGEAYDYVSGIDDVIDSLDDQLRDGHAENIIALAEYGLETLEKCLERVDDSNGLIGGLLHRLQNLHLEACRLARPDPVKLAERLFEWEIRSSYDTFFRAAAVYADVLGEEGIAAYRRLAEAEWAKVPALGPGDEDPNRWNERFSITSIMETIAQASGDLEALVAVKSRDLSLPYAFLKIAELYQAADDPDRALNWAERGWRSFAEEQRDDRLRAFLVEAYQHRERHDEAMTLCWDAFAERPSLERYRQLERHASRAGQWPVWRPRALALVRERIDTKSAEPSDRRLWTRGSPSDHSVLVEIFLHEGDLDGAWREAETGGCSRDLWLALAKRREVSHPDDAVRIYRDHIAWLLKGSGSRAYEDTIEHLEKIAAVLAKSGRQAEFDHLVREIRATQKRKRNLMKMLDRKGW